MASNRRTKHPLPRHKVEEMNVFKFLVSFTIVAGFLWTAPIAAEGMHNETEPAQPNPQVEQRRHEGSGGQHQPAPPMAPQQNQPVNSPIQQWPGFFNCGPSKIIMDGIMGQQGEIPMLQGGAILTIPGAQNSGQQTQMIQTQMVQYFNPKTLTFSIVSHLNNGMSCIIVFGSQLSPAANGHDQRPPKPDSELSEEELKKRLRDIPPVDPRDIKRVPSNEIKAAWVI